MWNEEQIKEAKKKIAEANAVIHERWKGYEGNPEKAPGVRFIKLKRVLKTVVRIMTS